MRAPFPDWNAESLRDLVLGEGFGEVRIHLDIRGVRFPSPAEYLRQEASSSPLAGPIAALPPDTRAAMLDDLQESLSDYADDEGLAFPMETHLVVAS